jgi:hypothetical protein
MTYMKYQPYNGLSDDEAIRSASTTHATNVEALREKLAHAARHLVEHFRFQRELLHEAALAGATVGPDGRSSVSSFCSTLTPECRIRRGTLTIEWIRMTFGAFGDTQMMNLIVRKRGGDYKPSFLRKWAKDYEADLVEQTEIEASVLRARWRALDAIERGARDLERTIRTANA